MDCRRCNNLLQQDRSTQALRNWRRGKAWPTQTVPLQILVAPLLAWVVQGGGLEPVDDQVFHHHLSGQKQDVSRTSSLVIIINISLHALSCWPAKTLRGQECSSRPKVQELHGGLGDADGFMRWLQLRYYWVSDMNVCM